MEPRTSARAWGHDDGWVSLNRIVNVFRVRVLAVFVLRSREGLSPHRVFGGGSCSSPPAHRVRGSKHVRLSCKVILILLLDVKRYVRKRFRFKYVLWGKRRDSTARSYTARWTVPVMRKVS